ncbi:MAG: amino acid adenylation domain-containing protein, partial [Acidobacteria bacterium]|nr:amino acid adenylation domain-containing protein [Acidobacteriota bacterium]
MLITKFKEQVKKAPSKLAVKGEKESFTYNELDRVSDRIAQLIMQTNADGSAVGLLLEHGPHMIAAILGTLKARKIYVPISIDYPLNRISYMLFNSQAGLIVTNTANEIIARRLACENNLNIVTIDENKTIGGIHSNKNKSINTACIPGNAIAYIMYTSGSTGRPKGVIQTQENIWYYTRNWSRLFSITETDRMTLFSSFCHDGSVQDMFSALLNGATLYPYDLKKREDSSKLAEFLMTEKITIWHSVPSLFSYFCTTLSGIEQFPNLRFILLGGEPIREHEIDTAGKIFPHCLLVNVYGQTESSVNSVWIIDLSKEKESGALKLRIGEPLDETQILVVDAEGNEVDVLEQGEIVISSNYLSPGYWQDPETTRKVFSDDEELGRLYWTGDLGRVLPVEKSRGDSTKVNIEFLGRKDFQVKIRGFRIELGEIENQLLKHEKIKEAIVTARENQDGEKYLTAYYTLAEKNSEPIDSSDLKMYLKKLLPDYMIPAFFMELDQFPLTQSNKIDRNALPAPGSLENQATLKEYIPPQTPVEKKVTEIWAEVLKLDKTKLSIHANFFELGGHSLKATIMAAKIQQAFAVRIPFTQIFENYTIRTLAEYITLNSDQKKEFYLALEPAEAKEYYPLSSAQERLFFLQQMDPEGTGYNISITLELIGNLQTGILTGTFKKLIDRHESFRTSFHIIDEKTTQKIHREVDFNIEHTAMGNQAPQVPIKEFIRPFDLSSAPLLRVGVLKISNSNHLLVIDMHHIISDGTSVMLLAREFMDIYAGKANDISPLHVHYKDYALWQLNEKETLIKQGEWWRTEFSGEIPVLDLPLDYPRPIMQNFAGSRIIFETGSNELEMLHRLVLEPGITATLYMALLAIYAVLLSKMSGQEELVIGAPIANRRHPDLAPIIGMFVNTLALHVYPDREKTFKDFLKEIKLKTLLAFENQEYPFEELVENVAVNRDASRNPLFDAAFILQNIDFPTLEIPGLTLKPYPYDYQIAKFDLLLQATELEGKRLVVAFEYCTKLFKQGTIERFAGYFKRILSAVIENPEQKIADIEILSDSEKEQLLIDFNETAVDYPLDKTIQQLFAGQAAQTPDYVALHGCMDAWMHGCMDGWMDDAWMHDCMDAWMDGGMDAWMDGEVETLRATSLQYQYQITYRQLNDQSNRLAGVLIEKGVLPDDIVGIMMERSIDLIIAILGILKAGGAYLPIDLEYPQERIDYMLKDSGTRILITNNENKKTGNYQCSIVNCQLSMSGCPRRGLHHSSFIIHHSNFSYIIYTSGSTGKPKGVLVEQHSVVNILFSLFEKYPLHRQDCYLLKTTYVFDVSVSELFGWFLGGGKLAILPPGSEKEPAQIIQAV